MVQLPFYQAFNFLYYHFYSVTVAKHVAYLLMVREVMGSTFCPKFVPTAAMSDTQHQKFKNKKNIKLRL